MPADLQVSNKVAVPCKRDGAAVRVLHGLDCRFLGDHIHHGFVHLNGREVFRERCCVHQHARHAAALSRSEDTARLNSFGAYDGSITYNCSCVRFE